MAKAIKCDRCGEFFDPDNTDGVIYRIDRVAQYTSENFKDNTVGAVMFEKADLCPFCGERFAHFMEGTPTAYEEELEKQIFESNCKCSYLEDQLMGLEDGVMEKFCEKHGIDLEDDDTVWPWILNRMAHEIGEGISETDPTEIKEAVVGLVQSILGVLDRKNTEETENE